MRNLRITRYEESRHNEDLPITASAFDVSDGSIICAFGPTEERPIIELKRKRKSSKHNIGEDGYASPTFASITSWDAPCPLPDLKCDEILLLQHFADISTTCLVLAGGDVVIVRENPTPEQEKIEIVGSVDAGILAAAWAPDEELLVLVTRADTLVLMSRSFEPVTETTLTPDDLKASKHVSVGWGKKETQFQGKGAKASRDPTMPESVDEGEPSTFEDGKVNVSWRGDGAYFAVNSRVQSHRRVIRVFSREAVLDSASEPVDGLESALSWRPYGNLIAGIKRAEKLEVVLFERNGLRHGQFDLHVNENDMGTWASRISLCWNTDSTVLAVIFIDRVQLWTMGNYHYYLKQEILVSHDSTSILPSLLWHTEKSLNCVIHTKTSLLEMGFTLTISRGSTIPPHDYGIVAVIDGSILKLTPFKSVGVPPPMSFCEVQCSAPIVDCAVSADGRRLVALTGKGTDLCDWEMQAANTKHSDSPLMKHSLQINHTNIILPSPQDPCLYTQVELIQNSVYVLAYEGGCSRLWQLDLDQKEDGFRQIKVSDRAAGLENQPRVQNILADSSQTSLWIQDEDHTFMLDQDGTSYSLDESCPATAIFSRDSTKHDGVNGYTDQDYHKVSLMGGLLRADEQVLAKDCTSFVLTNAHLLFTTSQHLLKFVHLGSPSAMEVPGDTPEADERCRSIERGARIVTAIPSTYAVILQMPRGNLETIYPRVLVLSGIRKHISDLDYKTAFLSCQTQQVDMNILHDYNPELFTKNIHGFVNKLKKPSRIDEFISKLKDEDVTVTLYKDTLNTSILPGSTTTSSKVNRICDALIADLQARSSTYLQNIIMAHVCKRPPSLTQALSLISTLRHNSPEDADLAVSHLCFLTDTTRLYDAALSLYDLELALLVAQNAQRDPKEYMPFLRSLQSLPTLRRKYTTDNHLKNYSSALTHLHALNAHEEVEAYTQKHSLYTTTMTLYAHSPPHLTKITRLYASHLSTQNQPTSAAILYESLGDYTSAYPLYATANQWRESLTCATLIPLPPAQITALATELSTSLLELRDFRSAAQIHLDYLSSPPTAATLLCKGSYFAEATRVLSLHHLPSQIPTLIDPALREKFGELLEFLADCKSQLAAQTPRILELREKKLQDPLAFYGGEASAPDGGEGDIPDNISLAATDASTLGGQSLFTRYGGDKSRFGGTVNTAMSRKTTSRSKRREERKRARGKKGSVYEEEYLVASVGRLVERVGGMVGEVERLRTGLGRRGMRELSSRVDQGMEEMERECTRAVEEIWGKEGGLVGSGEHREGERPRGGDGVLWDSLQGQGTEGSAKRPEVKGWKRSGI